MKRIIVGMFLLSLVVGCRTGTVGPGENRKRPGVDPLLSIDEQKRYGAERYSIPEDTSLIPKGFADRPSPSGR